MVLSKFAIQVLITIGVIFLTFVVYPFIYSLISRKIPKNKIKRHNAILIKRLISLSIWTLAAISIVIVWNFGFENIWVTITSFLALVAIGFFAVWSLLSNVVAGIILYLSRPFEIGDKITILPEDFEGTVERISSMFTEIKDKDNNLLSIPNNLMFQKIIKKHKQP